MQPKFNQRLDERLQKELTNDLDEELEHAIPYRRIIMNTLFGSST